MSERFTWHLEEKGGTTVVRLSGEVTEDADFGKLMQTLSSKRTLEFNLGGIQRINSVGVRHWTKFVHELGSDRNLAYSECSPSMVAQMNMIRDFVGSGKVKTIRAPFLCSGCDEETTVLFSLAECQAPKLAGHLCPKCGGELEFDDLPDSYFMFARRG